MTDFRLKLREIKEAIGMSHGFFFEFEWSWERYQLIFLKVKVVSSDEFWKLIKYLNILYH